MSKPKQVQIDLELFEDLAVFVSRHAEPGDYLFERVKAGVMRKFMTIDQHNAYSMYITGRKIEDRQQGRLKYMDLVGMFDSVRWPDEQDYNVNRPESILP